MKITDIQPGVPYYFAASAGWRTEGGGAKAVRLDRARYRSAPGKPGGPGLPEGFEQVYLGDRVMVSLDFGDGVEPLHVVVPAVHLRGPYDECARLVAAARRAQAEARANQDAVVSELRRAQTAVVDRAQRAGLASVVEDAYSSGFVLVDLRDMRTLLNAYPRSAVPAVEPASAD